MLLVLSQAVRFTVKRLPESLRAKLKVPLGVLIHDNKVDKVNILYHIHDDSYVVTVGDRTTEKLLEFGIIPSLQIIDGIEQRHSRDPPLLPLSADDIITIPVKNPATQITQESIHAIQNAVSMNRPVRIFVNGEEDLLVLPVCIYAPDGAVVFYGQPNEGMVVTKITNKVRNKARDLLDMMVDGV